MNLIRINGGLTPSERGAEYARFWGAVMPAVVRTVEQSFISRGMVSPTGHEAKRRVDLAKDLVDEMRSHGWSIQRIRDNLPMLLDKRIDGQDIDIPAMSKRGIWMPPGV